MCTGTRLCPDVRSDDLRAVALLALCAGWDRALGDADGRPRRHAAIHGSADATDDGAAATDVLPATTNVLPSANGGDLLPRTELWLPADLMLSAMLDGRLLWSDGLRPV